MSTRSEPASPRKLKRARELGDHPSSPLVTRALTLGAGLCVLPAMFVQLWWDCGNQLRLAFHNSGIDTNLSYASRYAMIDVLKISLPFLAAITVTQLASNVIATGGLIAKRQIGFGWHQLNPLRGLATYITWRNVITQSCAISLALLVVLFSLVWMRSHAEIVATLGTFRDGLYVVVSFTKQLLLFAFFAWAVVACIDFALSHRLWLQKLKMSPEEKRHEQKEAEGDPQVLLQRARYRQQLLSESSNWSLREATIVVQHQRRIAAVLHYDPADRVAPRLLGVGIAELAANIVAEAYRFDIPVVEQLAMAQALASCSVGELIPERLYSPIAELVSEIYSTRTRRLPAEMFGVSPTGGSRGTSGSGDQDFLNLKLSLIGEFYIFNRTLCASKCPKGVCPGFAAQ